MTRITVFRLLAYLIAGSVATWGLVDFALDEFHLKRGETAEHPTVRKRISSVALAILGLFAVFVTWKLDSLNDNEQVRLQQQVDELQNAQSNVSKEFQRYQSRTERLERETASRTLTKTQTRDLVRAIKTCSSSEFHANVFMGDQEGRRFAQQIVDAFSAAGWRTTGVREVVPIGGRQPASGLILRIRSGAPFHPCANVFADALRKAGHELIGETDPNTPNDSIMRILIGIKPRAG